MNTDRFAINRLGEPTVTNPLAATYVSDDERLAYNPYASHFRVCLANSKTPEGFEVAGPREKVFFNPSVTSAAIVTCGGLCPGLNAVIRALVMQIWHRYGCRRILGVRYGYHGLDGAKPDDFVQLDPEVVNNIHMQGGTILGSSRGTPPTPTIVDTLTQQKVDILFVIGGDGTMRGALEIQREIERRKMRVAVIGVPKTIDNDIAFVRRSFGFETAVAIACDSIHAAHEEARGARGGIGLVKLMGRNSGYIAANATLATGHVNFCLVPEVSFRFEGQQGLFSLVEKRLKDRGHCVIVAAEGAGQEYFMGVKGADASGNPKLGDVGILLRDRLGEHLRSHSIQHSIKYIDPSYMIRAATADPADQLFCARLAQGAVHAAMAGKTGMLIGYWHGRVTHVPFSAMVNDRQTINPGGELWSNVLEMTGQPSAIL
jgi:6-phosphofructokinase 1